MQKRVASIAVGLALVCGVTVLVLRSAQQITVPELTLESSACDPSPVFRVMNDPYNSLRKTERGWSWGQQGSIEIYPCQGGTLIISGYGVKAGGDWPLLIASLELDGLGSWKFDRRRSLTVNVPRAGRITLAFMNGYYNAEQRPIQQRKLYLEQVRFTPNR